MTKLSIIIPCYYNEGNVAVTMQHLISNEQRFPEDLTFEYILIDDGSGDNTLKEIRKVKTLYPGKIKGLKLAGNVGSYNAIVAGMEYATGDCTVIIAADLQDPPELMVPMFQYLKPCFQYWNIGTMSSNTGNKVSNWLLATGKTGKNQVCRSSSPIHFMP